MPTQKNEKIDTMTETQLNTYTIAIKERVSKIKHNVRKLSNIDKFEKRVDKLKNDLSEMRRVVRELKKQKNEIGEILQKLIDIRDDAIAIKIEIESGWIRENTALMICGVSRPHFRDNIAPHVRTSQPSPRTLYYNVDDLLKWKVSNIK